MIGAGWGGGLGALVGEAGWGRWLGRRFGGYEQSPAALGAQNCTTPPTIVSSTESCGIRSPATASGYSDSTTRSAYLPTEIVPLRCSENVPYAPSAVSIRSAWATVIRWLSIHGRAAAPEKPIRVAA